MIPLSFRNWREPNAWISLLIFVLLKGAFALESGPDVGPPSGFKTVPTPGDSPPRSFTDPPAHLNRLPTGPIPDSRLSQEKIFEAGVGDRPNSEPKKGKFWEFLGIPQPTEPGDRLQYSPQPKRIGDTVSGDLYPQTDGRDRFQFIPQAKRISDDGEIRPVTFEKGESSAATAERGQAAQDEAVKPKELPNPMVAKSLPDGSPDLWLQSSANKHIKDAIKALPYSRDEYKLVTMTDPTAPDENIVYRFYNIPGGMHKDRLPYTPQFLHDERVAIEEQEAKSLRNGFHGGDEFSWATKADGPTPNTFLGRLMGRVKGKLANERWKGQTGRSNAQDIVAEGRDRSLEHYHATGGFPTDNGREESELGETIPQEAGRTAQEMGGERIFYNPSRPQNPLRITYDGPLEQPESQQRGGWTYNRPDRRPTKLSLKWEAIKAAMRQRLIKVARNRFKPQPITPWYAGGVARGAADQSGLRQDRGAVRGGLDTVWKKVKGIGGSIKDKISGWGKKNIAGEAPAVVHPIVRRRL